MKTIKILIADDHAIVRMGLASLFSTQDGFKVIGDAEDGEAVVKKAIGLKPDVIIMDLMMPKKDGAAATAEIHAALPDAKIIVLTTFGTSDGIANALNAGATGAFMKNTPNSKLIEAIRTVANGGKAISEEVERLMEEDPPAKALTPRQMDILESLTRGLTNQDIATQLGIREDRVKEHVKAILSKLGAANRTEAATIAMRKHLLKF
jgi:two-component system NarL family response regulator